MVGAKAGVVAKPGEPSGWGARRSRRSVSKWNHSLERHSLPDTIFSLKSQKSKKGWKMIGPAGVLEVLERSHPDDSGVVLQALYAVRNPASAKSVPLAPGAVREVGSREGGRLEVLGPLSWRSKGHTLGCKKCFWGLRGVYRKAR